MHSKEYHVERNLAMDQKCVEKIEHSTFFVTKALLTVSHSMYQPKVTILCSANIIVK